MKRAKTTRIHILLLVLILCLCVGMMTGCAKEPSVEVLKQEKIEGYTVAVCKFPDKTIRLAMKTKEGYEPFFTIYEASVGDVPIEEIKIQTGQGALEHDYIRVMFRMEPFTQTEYELDYFSIDKNGNPICLAICKNQVYVVDMDGDHDNEIVTLTSDPDIEVYGTTALVYDWQDGKVVVSNVNKYARQIYNLPDATVYSARVKLPEDVVVAHPDANIYPEYGEYMTFEFEYIIPPDVTHYSGGLLDIRFKDLVFEPFSCSEIETILAP